MIADMVPPWGTKVHYMSGIHTNVTTVQLPSGQARYSYLRDKPQNGEMPPFMCIDAVCGSLKGKRDRVNEFYKKGCQEKSSPSTGRREDFVSRSSPLHCKSASRFA